MRFYLLPSNTALTSPMASNCLLDLRRLCCVFKACEQLLEQESKSVAGEVGFAKVFPAYLKSM